jgi:hypothetical protein
MEVNLILHIKKKKKKKKKTQRATVLEVDTTVCALA